MNDPVNLRYEETPILDPVPEASHIFNDTPKEAPPQPPPKGQRRSVGTILFVVILFGLGIWLASQLRSFFAPSAGEEVAVPTSGFVPTSRPTLVPLATSSGSVASTIWQTYEVVRDVTYQLPGDVKPPACDNANCASKGTYLPGGTRFTVAARGRGRLLPDFRGAILTDATGKEFDMQQTTVAGISVYEYSGDFTGRTGGGYTFTRIRGVLIPVSETLAIEFNHFAPAGITTDFVSDDVVFNKVVGSFTSPKPTVSLPTATPATTSGF